MLSVGCELDLQCSLLGSRLSANGSRNPGASLLPSRESRSSPGAIGHRDLTASLRNRRSQVRILSGAFPRRAAHVLWLVASFDGFDLLYTGRGLSARETGRILADTFENAVCT